MSVSHERRIYPWNGHGVRNAVDEYMGQINANFVRGASDYMGTAGFLNDNADVTAPVYSYWLKDYGLYNMAGNVSEWVMDVYRAQTIGDADEFRPFRAMSASFAMHKHKLLGAAALLATFSFLSDCGAVPEKASADDPAGNFSLVSPGIYRGGRPDQEGVQVAMPKLGIKTIIDLEDNNEAIDPERAWADQAGITFVLASLNGMETPDEEKVNAILARMTDPASQPVFVHCMEGRDRTGLIVGLHRVIAEGWQPQDAYDEMLHFGFRTILGKLKCYFKSKTSWGD